MASLHVTITGWILLLLSFTSTSDALLRGWWFYDGSINDLSGNGHSLSLAPIYVYFDVSGWFGSSTKQPIILSDVASGLSQNYVLATAFPTSYNGQNSMYIYTVTDAGTWTSATGLPPYTTDSSNVYAASTTTVYAQPGAGSAAVIHVAYTVLSISGSTKYDPATCVGGDGVTFTIFSGDGLTAARTVLWSRTVTTADTTAQPFTLSVASQYAKTVYLAVDRGTTNTCDYANWVDVTISYAPAPTPMDIYVDISPAIVLGNTETRTAYINSVNAPPAPGQAEILTWSSSTDSSVSSSFHVQGKKIKFTLSTASGSCTWESPDDEVQPSAWGHVAMTRTDYTVQFYFNGQPVTTTALQTSCSLAPSPLDTNCIGSAKSLVHRNPLAGRLFDVRFYDHAMTAAEVHALVTATPTLTPTQSLTMTDTHTPTPTETDSRSSTITPTRTETATPTDTPTRTETDTQTDTSTATPKRRTNTPTPTETDTRTRTRSVTPSPTPSPTETETRTPTDSETDTISETDTRTFTETPTPTETSTETDTRSRTISPTQTPTVVPTATPSPTPTPSPTSTVTLSSTATPTASPTTSPTTTFTLTSSTTITPTSTMTRSETDTETDTLTPTSTETLSPTPTRTGGCIPYSTDCYLCDNGTPCDDQTGLTLDDQCFNGKCLGVVMDDVLASPDGNRYFSIKVRVQSDDNQTVSPIVWAKYDRRTAVPAGAPLIPNIIFKEGEVAGAGLTLLAEEGDPTLLLEELQSQKDSGMVKDFGVISSYEQFVTTTITGQTFDFQVLASQHDFITFATMLTKSNDRFLAPPIWGVPFFIGLKPNYGEITNSFLLWDAGTEVDQTYFANLNEGQQSTQPGGGIAGGPRELGVVHRVNETEFYSTPSNVTYPFPNATMRVWINPGLQVLLAQPHNTQAQRAQEGVSAQVEFTLEKLKYIGNAMSVQLPDGFLLNHGGKTTANVTWVARQAHLGGSKVGMDDVLYGQPVAVDVSERHGTVMLKWGDDVKIMPHETASIVFRVTNIRTPNNCKAMIWRVKTYFCQVMNLNNAGELFVPMCQGPIESFESKPQTGSAMGCTLCNACYPLYDNPTSGMRVYACEDNQKRFLREVPLSYGNKFPEHLFSDGSGAASDIGCIEH